VLDVEIVDARAEAAREAGSSFSRAGGDEHAAQGIAGRRRDRDIGEAGLG
jgi:hypothetical protein